MTTHHCNGLAQCGTHPRWNMTTADAVRDEWGLEASIARVKNRLDHGTRYRLADDMRDFAHLLRRVEVLESAAASLLPTREELADLIPSPRVSERVADWPADEQEFHRNGNWLSFTDRAEQLDRMRRLKVADSILDRLSRAVPQSADDRAGSTP